MKTTKNAYLAKLTEQIQMKSVNVGKNLEGTTPPSVFIGRWSYPKVYAGPMMSSQMGDTYIMDSPESWIGENKTQDEIINYRMNLVRGKQLIKIGRFYPSSKRCSCCGQVKKELGLDERTYICACGNRMDRDVNAAINIREEGRRLLCG